jgi:putative colanic acid biosynthesis acetyltransferase WcaF
MFIFLNPSGTLGEFNVCCALLRLHKSAIDSRKAKTENRRIVYSIGSNVIAASLHFMVDCCCFSIFFVHTMSEQQMKTDLSRFDNAWYQPGGRFRRALWFIVHELFICSGHPISALRVALLRLFGAEIGKGVVIKPRVRIKYPWKLRVGNHTWIGEDVWIDNLGEVSIGDHSCLSQGAMLLCGNHDYKRSTFDLIVGDITLENGVWIGAKAVVCPGVQCHSHSVLSVGSVASAPLEAYGIYRGNPAVKIKERRMQA